MANTPSTSFRLSEHKLAELDRLAQLLHDSLAEITGRDTPTWTRTMALQYAISRALNELLMELP